MPELFKRDGTGWKRVHPGELVDEPPRMNPGDDQDDEFEEKARRIADRVYERFANEGGLVTAEEAKQIYLAEQDGGEADGIVYSCERCNEKIPGAPFNDPPVCPNCSHPRAIISKSPYKCADCGQKADPRLPRCPNPRCNGTKAVKV